MNFPVFVIGTGRSGTTFLGRVLNSHPSIRCTNEVEPMFSLSTKMALDPSLKDKLFDQLVDEYVTQLVISNPRIYADKSHTNIWLVEELKDAFPTAAFIALSRNVFGVVSSMMRHSGVMWWSEQWKEFPVPNKFLGITNENKDQYEKTPNVIKCSMRWLSHMEELKRLTEAKVLTDDNLYTVVYDNFLLNPDETLTEIQRFLGLTQPFDVPKIQKESSDKWRKYLTDEQVEQIHGWVVNELDLSQEVPG